MSSQRSRTIDLFQSLVVIVGITIGVIPLVGAVVGFGPGLLHLVLPEAPHASHYVVPVVIVVSGVLALFGLEAAKKRP